MLDWLKRQIGIPTLEEKLTALQTKAEQMEAQLFNDQLPLAALETKLEQMEEKLASDQSPQKLNTLRERVGFLESKIASSNGFQVEKLEILRGRLDQLEQRVVSDSQKMTTRISAIDDELNTKLGHSFTLTSPNGKQSISLIADNYCSGIWITGQKGEPMVAIYKMASCQGAVVGIYGPANEAGLRRSGLDACFYYDTTLEGKAGAIQLLTIDNRHLLLELAADEPSGSSTKSSETKVVGYIPPGIDEG